MSFRVEYAVESINREFGVVFTEGGENVSVMQVSKGLAKVKAPGGNDRAVANAEELERRELEAREAEAGMWSKDPAVLAAASQRTVVQAM